MAHARPTILQLIPHLDAGGAEMTTLEVTEAIVAGGGRALVLSEGGRLEERIIRLGGEIMRFPAATKNPARVIANGYALARVIGAEGVNLIHARSRAPAWSALLAVRKTNIPFVTTYHGAYSERGRIKNLYNSVMARSDIVIANSDYTAQSIRTRYGAPDNRIRIVYRGVDLTRFDPATVSAERIAGLRAKWQIPEDVRVILHMARVTPLKGQSVVIEAARRLKVKGRLEKAVVVFAGDAQGRTGYVEALQAQIAEGGLAQNIKLVGHVDDVPAAFAMAYVGLLVSTEPEGFGRSSVEAQAMRCPVILTRIGALPETLIAEPLTPAAPSTGWLLPPGDASALADAIDAALALTEAERSAIGARARNFVTRRFTTRELQRQTLAVYDELVGSKLLARFDA
ncbi:MAG: glycosyl transferase [Hyphomicrobium sp.]|nr:glycosyl transferase [Hyphomicrobium sp.]PPC81156.1 MAG: glycosyl transferase [Hyphomicrobium sp.]